jgi:hypothetical protein
MLTSMLVSSPEMTKRKHKEEALQTRGIEEVQKFVILIGTLEKERDYSNSTRLSGVVELKLHAGHVVRKARKNVLRRDVHGEVVRSEQNLVLYVSLALELAY